MTAPDLSSQYHLAQSEDLLQRFHRDHTVQQIQRVLSFKRV